MNDNILFDGTPIRFRSRPIHMHGSHAVLQHITFAYCKIYIALFPRKICMDQHDCHSRTGSEDTINCAQRQHYRDVTAIIHNSNEFQTTFTQNSVSLLFGLAQQNNQNRVALYTLHHIANYRVSHFKVVCNFVFRTILSIMNTYLPKSNILQLSQVTR